MSSCARRTRRAPPMAHADVAFAAAFVAGFLSFVSPPVVALLPGYVAFVAGAALESQHRAFVVSWSFVVGFMLAFIAAGATGTMLGGFLARHAPLCERIPGSNG